MHGQHSKGTKVVGVPYITITEWRQNTSILGAKSHTLHLHGFNFYVVGQGFGNFIPNRDTGSGNFNLVERNTVGVPSRGWIALRNPGNFVYHHSG